MITCNLMGGLGNQLFQIFTTIAFAIQYKKPFVFTQADKLGDGTSCTVRMTYWNTFLSAMKPFLREDFPPMKIIKECGHHYNEISIKDETNEDICLFGYFQSHQYFSQHLSTICRMIHLEEKKKEVFEKSKYDSSFLKNAVSIHFRLGDYKKLPHCHPIISYAYYESALTYIEEKVPSFEKNIIYFCENEDLEEVQKTIERLQSTFANYCFVRGNDALEDWEQMLLMSCCSHNIIANSTFSWWGAYFNNNKERITIYPSIWFGPAIHAETKDMFPSDWVKIQA